MRFATGFLVTLLVPLSLAAPRSRSSYMYRQGHGQGIEPQEIAVQRAKEVKEACKSSKYLS